MKSLHFLLFVLVVTISTAASGAEPKIHRLDSLSSSDRSPSKDAMILDGKKYTSLDALLNAIAALPRRSHVIWHSGCIGFDCIPLGPLPRISIAEFKEQCRKRGIRFDYICGLPVEPLVTRKFVLPQSILHSPDGDSIRADARKWLYDQGVVFGKDSYAHWWPISKTLVARNTLEQLDLIAAIIEIVGNRRSSKSVGHR